jgi:uncharacterized protein YkwD
MPITATFLKSEPLKDAAGKLTKADGGEIPCWFSTPEKPANPMFAKHQGTTVCLIPKQPLTPKTTYHVHLQGQLAGKAWEKKWKFTTGDGGPSVADATRQVLDRLNRQRVGVGLNAIELDKDLSRGCQLHADYLVKNADAIAKKNASVNEEDQNLPGFTLDGRRSAQQSHVFTHAPAPVVQIDDLMASASRVHLLDPNLQRIGFGCAHDIGRGWRCVLDLKAGRGESRVVAYPAADAADVPLVGFDRLPDVAGRPGFPISIVFPQRAKLGDVQAVLKDGSGNNVDIHVSSPAKPLDKERQRNIVGIHPVKSLEPRMQYSITVSVIVDGSEWRQTWQFTTKK